MVHKFLLERVIGIYRGFDLFYLMNLSVSLRN